MVTFREVWFAIKKNMQLKQSFWKKALEDNCSHVHWLTEKLWNTKLNTISINFITPVSTCCFVSILLL